MFTLSCSLRDLRRSLPARDYVTLATGTRASTNNYGTSRVSALVKKERVGIATSTRL